MEDIDIEKCGVTASDPTLVASSASAPTKGSQMESPKSTFSFFSKSSTDHLARTPNRGKIW
jgi:hypothetical protein